MPKHYRPRALKLDNTSVRAIRGPHKDGSGRWYWRAEFYVPEEKKRETIFTGWGSREEIRQEVSRLLAERDPVEASREEREAQRSDVQTVRDLLEVYMGRQKVRLALWRQEDAAGEAAVAAGTATKVRHSRDAISPHTYASRKTCAKHLARLLGARPLRSLHTDDLRDYVAQRREVAAGGTVRNEVATLSAAWSWGSREGRRYTSGLDLSWPHVLATPVRDKYTPTRDELQRVIAHLPDGSWVKAVVQVQAVLGCRIGALSRLPKRDVDLRAGTVRLKVKEHDRTIRVPEEVIELLQPWVESANDRGTIWGLSPRTVHRATSLKHKKKRNGTDQKTPWVRACEAAKVRRFTSHGIRRLVSNEWIRSGVNVAIYARVLGHSPEEALRAYSSILGSDELAAFERVAAPPPDNVEPLKRRRRRA